MSADVNSYSWEEIKLELTTFYVENVKSYIVIFLVGILLLIAVLYVCDYLYKDKYKIKWRIRAVRNTTGAGQDIYQKYWAWQINKKKFLMNELRKRNIQPLTGKAMKRKRLKESKVPFRREVYGKNN